MKLVSDLRWLLHRGQTIAGFRLGLGGRSGVARAVRAEEVQPGQERVADILLGEVVPAERGGNQA